MSRVTQIDGLPIVDAKRPLRLHITARDIAHAADSIKDPSSCAVAQACRRELHVKEARVHLGVIYLRTNNYNWVRYETPKSLRSEIISFDRGGSFEPSYVVLTPRRPSSLGTHATGGASAKNKNMRRKPVIVKNVRNGPA